uniref:Uncharacterized protein n=1 Tax=Myoviridae sp. ctDvB7 TaxID=2825057 RepID=A0A8S5UEE9_9CAUD|nr:MAG TPA: hypothetical protein [Myoviridae sp. ctDvB7]
MPIAFKNHKKAKENLPVCTVYGYVCKLKFAMKFKILKRRTSDDENRIYASRSKPSAGRRADANAGQSKKK